MYPQALQQPAARQESPTLAVESSGTALGPADLAADVDAALRQTERLLKVAQAAYCPGTSPCPGLADHFIQSADLAHDPLFEGCDPPRCPDARFFAAHPLPFELTGISGTLCISDPAPRTLDQAEIEILELLALALARQLEARQHAWALENEASLRRQLELRHHELARYDPLTGLPNRILLSERIGHALRNVGQTRGNVALLILNVDDFRLVNDTLGHQAGDALLVEVARRLQRQIRDSDTAARLGSDEFVVVLPGQGDFDGAQRVARAIQKCMQASIDIEGRPLTAQISIGIACSTSQEHRPEVLLRQANTALHAAKQQGRGRIVQFSRAEEERVKTHHEILVGLRHALENHEFRLHYQPQIDLGSGRLVGVEALVRWEHPERGLIPPDHFLPIAETHGLIVELGHWVLDTALAQLARWRAAGLDDLVLAVNASPRELSEQWASNVRELLERHRIAPASLEIEITESSLLEKPTEAIAWLRELRELGVGVALDDFGVGYSSLSQLKTLPITRLKLDRSFVSDIADPVSRGLIEAFAALARALGVPTVAEGIETPEQHRALSQYSRFAQGYFYSRPLPPEELEAWARAWLERAAPAPLAA